MTLKTQAVSSEECGILSRAGTKSKQYMGLRGLVGGWGVPFHSPLPQCGSECRRQMQKLGHTPFQHCKHDSRVATKEKSPVLSILLFFTERYFGGTVQGLETLPPQFIIHSCIGLHLSSSEHNSLCVRIQS